MGLEWLLGTLIIGGLLQSEKPKRESRIRTWEDLKIMIDEGNEIMRKLDQVPQSHKGKRHD